MRKLKWFTLVEILIVIVIIGILIWALVPRMQSAQWRARDVARKNDLAQLQTAIIASQQDKWGYPCYKSGFNCDLTGGKDAASWLNISQIENQLLRAGMNSIPKDPLGTNVVTWLGGTGADWEYRYLLAKSNWIDKWAVVLMAKTEVEWWSNRVYCGSGVSKWEITWGTEVKKNFQLCSSLTMSGTTCSTSGGTCTYANESELRYVLIY